MQQPEPDWESIGDWKNGRVRSAAKVLIWISLVFGVAFTGLGMPATLAVPEEIGKGNYAILAVLIFPVVGLAALALFIRAVMAWYKFGVTELVLDPAPGCIGGDFGGSIDTRIPYNHEHVFNIVLNCQHSRTTGSGKNRSTTTKTLWQREGVASQQATAGGGTRLEFKFDIPDDLPQSEASSSSYHHWLLQIHCELPCIDFSRTYTVPVFKLATPMRSNLNASYAQDSAPLTEAPAGKVSIENTADGLRFYYPWHRHLGMAIMLALTGSFFVAIGWFVGQKSGEIMFPVIFGLVGGIAALGGLYMMGNTLTTTVSPRGIVTIRNIFGFRFQRRVPKEEIVKFDRKISSQTTSTRGVVVFYTLTAVTSDGRNITIADTLDGSRLTDFVEQKVNDALGNRPTDPGDLILEYQDLEY